MSNTTTAKISASINGDGVSPEGLLFEIDVNSFPMVCANVASTGGKLSVHTPIGPEVIERIGKLQTARLAGRTTPDFEVFAEDGIGGSINYAGFISSPILELTKVSTTEKLTTVGEAALLDAMDLSIYGTGLYAEKTPTDSRGEPVLKPVPAAKNGDAPGTILALTNLLISNYEATIALIQHRSMERQQIIRQHSINTNGPLRIWRQMLADSDVKFQSWEAAFKEPMIAKYLSDEVRKMLIARMPGFWNKIRALQSSFQMYYVPSFEGVGHFERVDKKVADTLDVMEVSVSGFSVSDGSARILQPGGVVMYGGVPQWARPERGRSLPTTPVAFAPDPLLQGFIHQEAAPFWLLRAGGVPIFGSEMDGKKDPGAGVNLSLKRRREARDDAEAQKDKVAVASSRVMTEMCELIFKELQLAHASVSLTLPLDFSLTKHLGKRVILRIRGADDEETGAKRTEFTAFVQGFTHSVDLRGGKQMNSFTQVRLSHAKF